MRSRVEFEFVCSFFLSLSVSLLITPCRTTHPHEKAIVSLQYLFILIDDELGKIRLSELSLHNREEHQETATLQLSRVQASQSVSQSRWDCLQLTHSPRNKLNRSTPAAPKHRKLRHSKTYSYRVEPSSDLLFCFVEGSVQSERRMKNAGFTPTPDPLETLFWSLKFWFL